MAIDDYIALADQYAAHYNVPPAIVKSVIQTESGWNPFATGSVGEQGLMQIRPSNFKSLGITSGYDPEQNIRGGVKFLSKLGTQYGNWRDALAHYNSGVKLTSRGYQYADSVLDKAGGSDVLPQKSIGASGSFEPDSESVDDSKIKNFLRSSGLWVLAILLIIFGVWRLVND